MKDIDQLTIGNIQFHGSRWGLNEEQIENIVELYTSLPLVNVTSPEEIQEAVEKCENMSK